MELQLANHSSYPRIGNSFEGRLFSRTAGKGEKTGQDAQAAKALRG